MAIIIQKDIIPNEMRNIETLQWTTIPPPPDASGNVDPSANNTYKLTISDLSDNSGNTLYRFMYQTTHLEMTNVKKTFAHWKMTQKVLSLTNLGIMFLFMVNKLMISIL